MYGHDGKEKEGTALLDGQPGDVGERHFDDDDGTLKEKPIETGETLTRATILTMTKTRATTFERREEPKKTKT